jgi:hypothetical protein
MSYTGTYRLLTTYSTGMYKKLTWRHSGHYTPWVLTIRISVSMPNSERQRAEERGNGNEALGYFPSQPQPQPQVLSLFHTQPGSIRGKYERLASDVHRNSENYKKKIDKIILDEIRSSYLIEKTA